MSNEIKYCDRDVIFTDDQIEEIVNKAKKELYTNNKPTPLSMFEKDKIGILKFLKSK